MALKWHLFCPMGVLLLSGLFAAGCSQEEKKLDRLIVSTPKIIRAGNTVELATWDKNSSRGLDLHDALDVSNSGATSLNIKSSCDRADYHSNERFDFIGLDMPIKIFQFIPQELLSADLSKAAMTCSFVLIFGNIVGSQHVLHIATTPIQDDGRADVKISPEKIVRYNSQRSAKAAVLCPDMTTSELAFHQVTELKYFDFKNFIPREGRQVVTLLEKPLQVCRVGIFENEKLVAISEKFAHVVERAPLSSLVEYQAPGDFAGDYITTYHQFFQKAVPLRMMTEVYKNPLPITRHLRLPKQNIPAIYEVYAHDLKNRDTALKHPVATNRLFLVPEDRGGATIVDEGESWRVILNGAESSFAITLMASPTGTNCSPLGTALLGMLVYPNGPIFMSETLPSSQDVINQVELNAGAKVFLWGLEDHVTRAMIDNAKTVPAPIYCGWTF